MEIATYPVGTNRFEHAGGGASSGNKAASDPNSRPTTLTAHATIGTDGPWTEFCPATADEWYAGFNLALTRSISASVQGLVDIAAAPAGSEASGIIVPDIPFAGLSLRQTNPALWIPLYVPKGKRLAARVHRASVASATVDINLTGQPGSPRFPVAYHRCGHLAIDLANRRGTLAATGAANTKGALVQLIAATPDPIRCFYVFAQRASLSGSVTVDHSLLFELFFGANPNEVLFLPYQSMSMHGTSDVYLPMVHGPFFCDVPANTRITVQSQVDVVLANASDPSFSILYFW